MTNFDYLQQCDVFDFAKWLQRNNEEVAERVINAYKKAIDRGCTPKEIDYLLDAEKSKEEYEEIKQNEYMNILASLGNEDAWLNSQLSCFTTKHNT